MAVSTTTRKQLFNMDGVVVKFSFNFFALTNSPTDIKCKLIVKETQEEDSDLEYTTDYSVTINANGNGGFVTVEDAQSEDYQLLVYRLTTDKQESDYTDYNQFPADTLERDLDRRTLVTQELADDLLRTVTFPLWSDLEDFRLPSPVSSHLIGWNFAATRLINVDPKTLVPAISAKYTEFTAVTDNYTLVLTDDDKIVEVDKASAVNLTIPLNSSVAFPVGTTIGILQKGEGQVTIVATEGVTVNSKDGMKLSGQFAGATLIKRATNTWYLNGDTAE